MTTRATMRALDEDRGAVRVEDVYATDLDDLWEACTTPERLARWIAVVSGDLRVGGSVHAEFTSGWSGTGRVEVCEEPHHLLVRFEEGSEETELEAWLTAEDGGTRLVVEERGMPRSQLPAYGAGWQAHLEDLGRSLAGEASTWEERWSELVPEYRSLPVG